MKYVGYYNGKIGPLENMQIPMLDRAVYFGDGCYDATTFRNNRIFGEKDHFDRFYNSCKLLKIPFDMSREQLHTELQACIDANELDHGMIYWQCSRGTYFRQHNFPTDDIKPNLMIFTSPFDMVPFDKTMKLISLEDNRFNLCNIKTLNLIPSVLAYEECVQDGCDETVLYRNEYGRKRVTECAHSNVLIIKDGVLISPPRDNLILPRITLKHLLMFARQNNIPTKETPFTLDDLIDADEVIISSSGGLCISASEIDGKSIGGKAPEILKTLQDAYAEYYENDTND
jgi:D-alanine transaminase